VFCADWELIPLDASKPVFLWVVMDGTSLQQLKAALERSVWAVYRGAYPMHRPSIESAATSTEFAV